MQPHDEGDLFDARYPPDTTLPESKEYPHEDYGHGLYGWHEEADRAVIEAANPKCVWTFTEVEGCLYSVSGIRFVNRQYYYISSVPRPDVEDDYEEYQHTIDEDDEDE